MSHIVDYLNRRIINPAKSNSRRVFTYSFQK